MLNKIYVQPQCMGQVGLRKLGREISFVESFKVCRERSPFDIRGLFLDDVSYLLWPGLESVHLFGAHRDIALENVVLMLDGTPKVWVGVYKLRSYAG